MKTLFLHAVARIMEKKSFYTCLVVATLCLLGQGCITSRPVKLDDSARLINCHLDNSFVFHSERPVQIDRLDIVPALTQRFSFTSLNIANAFGFLDLLQDYLKADGELKSHPGIENRVRKMEIAANLAQHVDLASLEISSFASELDCEEERITQLADFLRAKEIDRESRLTVAAISVGAVGAIASGILSANAHTENAGIFTGIAGGIAEAIIGVLILKNSKTVELQHPRNVLRDIWQGGDSSAIVPTAIWYYLTYKHPEKPEELSLRQKIIERWKGFKQINAENPNDIDRFKRQYFQDEGLYSTGDLYNRANMYDQIESAVKLIKQDLSTLLLEIKMI